MSEPLDVNLRLEDIARYASQLLIENWLLRRKVEVLEARLDVLDPPVDEQGVGDAALHRE